MIRTNWTRDEICALFDLPLLDLLWQAQQTHRHFHMANDVQLSTLLSIKTGGCPEIAAIAASRRTPPLGFRRAS